MDFFPIWAQYRYRPIHCFALKFHSPACKALNLCFSEGSTFHIAANALLIPLRRKIAYLWLPPPIYPFLHAPSCCGPMSHRVPSCMGLMFPLKYKNKLSKKKSIIKGFIGGCFGINLRCEISRLRCILKLDEMRLLLTFFFLFNLKMIINID